MNAVVGATLSRFRHRSILWGYVAIVGIALASTLGILIYDARVTLLLSAKGNAPPFVVFAVAVLFLIAVTRPLWLVVTKHPEPTRQLIRDASDNRWWLLTCALMALAIPQSLQFASVMKKAIPQLVPFYADHAIIDIEYAILGTDAWRLTHAFIGPAATRFIDTLYGLWHLVNISLLCWLVLSRNPRFQIQGVLSYQLSWILLGGFAATALSSVGPCFLETFTGDTRFVPMMERLHSIEGEDGLHSLTAMGYLLDNEGKDAFGAGISAMPSLHVGIAWLTVLVAFDQSEWKLIRAGTLAYFVLIVVGSVHLGWHYLLDGVASFLGVSLIWWATGRFRDWCHGGLNAEANGPLEAPHAAAA